MDSLAAVCVEKAGGEIIFIRFFQPIARKTISEKLGSTKQD